MTKNQLKSKLVELALHFVNNAACKGCPFNYLSWTADEIEYLDRILQTSENVRSDIRLCANMAMALALALNNKQKIPYSQLFKYTNCSVNKELMIKFCQKFDNFELPLE